MFKSHVKLQVLATLVDGERSGYDLMSALAVHGAKQSPGYIYPLLHDLKERGYVSVHAEGRRKLYSITPKGKRLLATLEQNKEEMLRNTLRTLAPIVEREELDQYMRFRAKIDKHKQHLLADLDVMQGFHDAIFAVYDTNDPVQRKQLRAIMLNTTKEIRRLSLAGRRAERQRDRKTARARHKAASSRT
jgi:DNA-binding PadR family transcriptional regulator